MSTKSDRVDHIKADCPTVTHLLYCILMSPKCELFKQVLDTQNNIDELGKYFKFKFVSKNSKIIGFFLKCEKITNGRYQIVLMS